MKYKNQILLFSTLSFLVLVYVGWTGYNAEFVTGNCLEIHQSTMRCVDIVFFGQYQVTALLSLTLLLSLVPLFFTKEHAYIAWRKFAVWALPIMLVFIFTSPTHTGGGWALNFDIDREMASLFSAVVFTLASWLITARTALKH